MLRFIQKEYYHNTFSINIHNSKGTWKLIKNIINKSNNNKNNYVCKNNDSSFSIANTFNDIFSNVGNNLAKLIIKPNINTSIHDTLEDKNKYSFFISPTTPSEIYNINKNTSKYSTDIFNMNTILFKYIHDEISPILSLLFNRCINEGLFPDEFKKAKIKPLYKSSSKNDMLNFTTNF